jgi:hypothetical protein
MLPWDFGIINAIKKELAFSIFPNTPPEEMRKTPYLIFELKNIRQGKNLLSRVEFTLTIVDDENISGRGLNILKNINRIISKQLTLSQSNATIGSARVKIDSIESRQNNLIVNLVAILQLEALYEDTEISDA